MSLWIPNLDLQETLWDTIHFFDLTNAVIIHD